MKKHKMDVCGLLETKLLPSKVASFQKFRLRHWQQLSNANVANTARIVVFWNPSTVKVDLLSSSAQAVHLSISCLISHISFKATFVYGFNTITARRSLWEDLRSWNSNSPWMVLGDFNSMLSSVDKHNGSAVSSYETSDFRDCCSDLGLHDANFTGCHFSWTNGSVWCKLDRVLINPAWFSLQHLTHVHFDPPVPRTVSSCWSSSVYGTPMYILYRKLKLLKGPLKELNRLHFSHISKRVYQIESKLEQLQVSFQLDRANQLLLDQDKLLRSKLSFLKFVENQFFSQKIKCKFLKESDRGSKFFHVLMGQNHRRNFIPAIMCRNGNLSDSLKAVGDEFVAYYQQLLGSSKSTIPIDSVVIRCGPCLPSSSHSLLLSPVSAEDIRQAALQGIVSPMQNAFLGGRYMSDNINLVQELLRHQLGFPAAFVKLVMQCVSSASYSVAINGDIHGFLAGHSGVRQGDPLSPYLFICCMEYFSRMLMLASQQGVFRFHPKCAMQAIISVILRAMLEYFDFSSSDMHNIPVWVKFPNLPLKCWSLKCLSKIASVLGERIKSDMLTSSMSRLLYVKVLVKVNLLSNLPYSIEVTLPNGSILHQQVVYETLP
uniref:Reverse transcriptase domain-containing protein n=1 Tax=Populus alba TaxID=43335 RepID=A0A4U5PL35_POPAL|nr:hypothetical protein D5086_0000209670 [Populus alba]